jgi:hypothetical protein
VARAALVTGLFGAAGFVAAQFLKVAEIRYVPAALGALFGEGAWQTNWHSVLEQTYGLFNGLGVGVALSGLAGRQPATVDEPRRGRWTEGAAVAFVLLAIPYVNLVKNVAHWVRLGALPAALYGLPSRAWFDAACALVTASVLGLIVQHLRRPLAVLPANDLGKGQLLFLVLLWVVVAGNFMRALPPFAEQRLITEGVIHVNAVLCSVLVLLAPGPASPPEPGRAEDSPRALLVPAVVGLIVVAGAVAAAAWGTRALYGPARIPGANYHTRFGPDAQTGKPRPGQAHP